MGFRRNTLNKRVLWDLKKRSSIGLAFYVVVTFVVIFHGDFYKRNVSLSHVFMFLMIGICFVRFIHVITFNKIHEFSERLNIALFIITVVLTAAIWGGNFAYFMMLKNEFSVQLIMAVCTAGLNAGGVVAFLPEKRLAIVFNILMMLPSCIAMAFKGMPYNLIVLFLLFSGYLIMLAIRGNREYWDALENESHLEDKTVELKRLSHTDALTGIYNRRYFNEIFDFEWKRSSRDKTQMTVIMCDIDHFKKVNDTHGHIAGDEYLIKVAQILRSMFKRDTDIVARYGGEEFIMLLSGVVPEQAWEMAEELRRKVVDFSITFNGVVIRTTMSFGIASCIPENQSSASLLITRADHALYRAKNKGRNRVEFDQLEALG